MKRTNLKSITFMLLALAFTGHASRLQAQSDETCRTNYEQMRHYAESRPDMAAVFGKVFLSQGCAQFFPTVVESVKTYLAAVEQQNGKRPSAATAEVKGVPAAAQDGGFKPGDQIEAEWRSGRWYKAQILELKNGQYKIRYELDGVIDSVTIDKLRPIGATSPANTQNNTKNLTPKMAGGFPAIPGTAWKIDYGKGVTGYVFLFCKSARWEVISPQLLNGAVTLMGTFRVQGSNLISKDGNGGQVTTFKMAWKGDVLELNDGKVILKLHYIGETECK